MYSKKVLSLLDNINSTDFLPSKTVLKQVKIGEGMQQIIIACDDNRYYFAAIGSPYLLAMGKWLKDNLQQGTWMKIKDYQITDLVEYFSLPEHKRQDALLILNLIEQLNLNA
ncbi:hypothetical protein [Fastidiosibacter lacustris]|uniref:hypothetical protein n=1 Tax=Fastidiosibacter lacustris TaxID=2056695 RepID=UPI000E342AF0|nr:hypothetical protein [Fastidiosibacter lacustris]